MYCSQKYPDNRIHDPLFASFFALFPMLSLTSLLQAAVLGERMEWLGSFYGITKLATIHSSMYSSE